MLDFGRDESIELIRNAVDSFATDTIIPNMREYEAERGVPDEIRATYQEMGLHLMGAPEALGGSELGARARLAINEAMGRADPGAALALDQVGLALSVLGHFGGEAAQTDLASLCPTGLDQASVQVVVIEDDAIDRKADPLNLEIPWIPSADADVLVLLNAHGIWVINGNMVFTDCRGSGLRASGAASVSIFGAPVVLQRQGTAAAGAALAECHLYAASLMIGVMDGACRFSRDYAKERVAFGRPIAHHQALAFEMVEMELALIAARGLAEEAACLMDASEDAAGAAAMAFIEAVEASHLIGPGAVQVLGGHGFMADFPVEKAMREVRALGLWVGGIERAKDVSYNAFMGDAV